MRAHLPLAAFPVPPPSPTEYQRVKMLGELLGRKSKFEKGLEEGGVRVQQARERLAEEQGKVAELGKDMEEVDQLIAAHKAERRERRRREAARTPRVEEGGSEMDVGEDGGDVDSGGEVVVRIEEGKRRKVVRQGRFYTAACVTGNLDVEAVIQFLRGFSDGDRMRCVQGSGLGCAVSEASSEFADKSDINACFLPSTQEDAKEKPCG